MDDDTGAIRSIMQAPLEQFVAARSAATRELEQAGKPEMAGRIARLRKPSLTTWTLNQAAGAAPDDLHALRAAGEELRRSQERVLRGRAGAAAELQRATRVQRERVDALSRRLGVLLSASGRTAGPETIRRLADALRAASVADHATWTALREGRLTGEPDAAAFPVLDVALAPSSRKDGGEGAQDRKRLAAAEADVQRAETRERAAREQEDVARRQLEAATHTLRAARAALDDLRAKRGSSKPARR